MPRLPVSGIKMKKIKLGTTVQEQTAREIEKLRESKPDSIRTPGEAVDFVFNLITGLDPEVARDLDRTCIRRISSLSDEMNRLRPDGSEELSVNSNRLKRDQFVALHEYLSMQYKEDEEVIMGMKRVDLIDGSYAVFPSSWLLLESEENAGYCTQVGIIEIRGGVKYDAPHFVFFHNGEFDKKHLLEQAIKVWPRMKEVMRDEVKLVADDDGNYLNMNEHLAAPIICYFNLIDTSYYQSAETEPPYGAMIYRNNVD